MIISVSNLKKKYKDEYVVKGISFHVEKGEIFGFLGKNGAGKSTTVHMLTGITRPTSGYISIFDKPYEKLNEVKKRMGVLPDNSIYFNELTPLQHLSFFAKVKGINEDKKSLLTILSHVGLDKHADKKVGLFSLGMKKKLGIAQALIGNPELLFLDEPTATLDIESTLSIRTFIRSLAEHGTTVFMTSHNLDEIERLCDRVAILDHGKIKATGSINEVTQSASSRLQLQVKIKALNVEQIHKVEHSLIQANLITSFQASENQLHMELSDEESIPAVIQILVNL
jgi:ABC-2 type transport system ATP-binding protein